MNRREPLVELPLDRFLHSDPSLLRSARNKKRPLSPGTPTLFSPAKRRILNEEGVFSPEKTVKTPLFVPSQAFGSPARFADVLVGPSSPARVLDFGSRKPPQPDPIKATFKAASSIDRSLAPSPELKAARDNESNLGCEPPCATQYQGTPRMKYVLVPRELPPPPDPTSTHYPGFAVYQDPYIAEYSPASDDEDSAMDVDPNDELEKENARPRRPTKKAASTPNVKAVKSSVSVRRANSLFDMPDQQRTFSTPSRIYSPLPEHFSSQESLKSVRSSQMLLQDGMDSDDD